MQYLYPNSRLIIFAKAPVLGTVKTRLIPDLGAEKATELYKYLATKTLNIVTETAVAPIELWTNAEHPFLQKLAEKHNCSTHIQTVGDLGEKISHATANTLTRADNVVLIGTDAVSITNQILIDSFKNLQNNIDVVIGPANDGGYVLIGMSHLQPELFTTIDWSTEKVLLQTKQKIKKSGISYHELPLGYDIDNAQDLHRLPAKILDQLNIKI